MNQEVVNGNTGISCPHDQTGNQVPKRKIRPLRGVVLAEDSVAQGEEVLACVVDAVTGEEEYHHLALVGARNLQGVVDRRNQVQVEVVGRAVASSVVAVDVVLVLGAGVAPLQDAEALDQGPVGKLEGGWLDLEDPRDLARLALNRSFQQL